jgi:hypothetical protein
VAFIKVNSEPGKEEEYEKLLTLQQKKSKNAPYINLRHIEQELYNHIETPNDAINEVEERLHHLPDSHLLLWPDLDFLPTHDS